MNSHVAVTWELTAQNVAKGYGSTRKEMNGGAQVLPSDILARASKRFDQLHSSNVDRRLNAEPGNPPAFEPLLLALPQKATGACDSSSFWLSSLLISIQFKIVYLNITDK
jgi:hypothetical protein